MSQVLSVVAVLAAAAGTAGAERVTLYAQPSAFQQLRVEEDRELRVRYLCNAACDFVHGEMALDGPFTLRLDYMQSMLAGLAYLAREPRRMLFVGMGIGAMPRFLAARYVAARLDVVEIDPAVPPLARRFFGFSRRANVAVHVADGRAFVERAGALYDVIFVDACFGPAPPPQLATAEFATALRRRLAPGGVVAVNLAAPALNPMFARIVAGYRTAFSTVDLLAAKNEANLIVIATAARPTPENVAGRGAALTRRRAFGFDLAALAAQRVMWSVPAGTPALHDSDLR